MSAWSMKFDDELERIGYRVRWEHSTVYTVYAPGEVYLTTAQSLEDGRTAAYNHWRTTTPYMDKDLVEACELIGYLSMALEMSLPLVASKAGKAGIEKALAAYRKWAGEL